jgi:hypothetical protein
MVENVVLNAFPFLENGTLRNENADSPNQGPKKKIIIVWIDGISFVLICSFSKYFRSSLGLTALISGSMFCTFETRLLTNVKVYGSVTLPLYRLRWKINKNEIVRIELLFLPF